MKVQVHVKMCQGKAAGGSLAPLVLFVGPSDTAAGLRSRVEAVEPLAGVFAAKSFVIFEAQTLQDGQRLADSGVKEGCSLDLVVQVSTQALAQQLAELLKAQASAVSLEELSLMFSHSHGVSIGRVLEALGCETKLGHFLEGNCKLFAVKDGLVSLLRADHAASKALEQIPEESCPAPAPRAEELEVRVSIRWPEEEGAAAASPPSAAEPEGWTALHRAAEQGQGHGEIAAKRLAAAGDRAAELAFKCNCRVSAGETVQAVKSRISQAELLPFPQQELMLGGRVLDDGAQLWDSLQEEETGLRTLELVVRPSENILAEQLVGLLLPRASRASSPDELSLLYCYRHGTTITRALKFLGRKEKFSDFLKRQKHFILENGCVMLAPTGIVKASRLLDTVLEGLSFLNIRRVEKQLQTGNITATISLDGLPSTGQGKDRWLPALLKSVASGLQERLDQEGPGIHSICLAEGSVQVKAEDLTTVVLRFSPFAG
jgi:hypothetical protein